MDFLASIGDPRLLLLTEEVIKRARNKPRSVELIKQSTSLQLPIWGNEIRCLPNEILRSALFNAKNRNQPRRYLKNESIAIIDRSAGIKYTGEELRQNDQSVWLQMIHLAKGLPVGAPIEFTAYSMIKALRLTTSKPSQGHVDRLRESLTRMQATALSVHSKRLRHGISLSMIPKFEWRDEATGIGLPKWRVSIAPELVDLYGVNYFTHLQLAQRLDLPSGLATWMHGYLASHKKPFPISLQTLRDGCGCTTVNSSKFKQMVGTALTELVRVDFLKTAWIKSGMVHTERL